MNTGKTLFAQIDGFPALDDASRASSRAMAAIAGVRAFNCAEQFRAMAFAQLT